MPFKCPSPSPNYKFTVGCPCLTEHFPSLFQEFVTISYVKRTSKHLLISLESVNLQFEQTKFPVFWQHFQIHYFL